MQRSDIRRPLLVGVGALVAGLLLVVLGLYVTQQGRTLPNTLVSAVDVGRMTPAEVRAAVEPVVEDRLTAPAELRLEDEVFALYPAEVDYRADVDATVAAALARGRQGGPAEVLTRLRSLWASEDVGVADDYDEAALAAWVEVFADEVDRDVFPGDVQADPDTLEVTFSLPHGSVTVRREETREALDGLLTGPATGPVDLPADTEPQRVPDADVEAVAAQVEAALDDDLELTADGASFTLRPSEVAAMIEVVERTDGERSSLELGVSAEVLDATIGDEVERFESAPVDARFVTSRTPPVAFDDQGSTSFSPVPVEVSVEPAQPGTSFDLELAVERLAQALQAGVRTVELELEEEEAAFTTEEAQALRPTHLLGTFTTYHPAGQARVVNIQLLADTIDGTVVLPGEQFSINGISGRRTCAAGYRPAGTIVAGELVDTCGGGTSQFGTTTFNAAFFAGVQLDQWKAHSWYFSRYPMGREATLSYPELDVRFTNTTEGALVVRTSYTPSSITVSIYGQPVASEVVAEHSGRYAPRPPGEQTRRTDDLCEGERRVVQAGFDGFSVTVVRRIEWLAGGSDREEIRTVYVPQTRIVEEGTRDCSPPEPPEPDEDEDEAEEPETDTRNETAEDA